MLAICAGDLDGKVSGRVQDSDVAGCTPFSADSSPRAGVKRGGSKAW